MKTQVIFSLLLVFQFTSTFGQSTAFPTENARWAYTYSFEGSVSFKSHELIGDSLYDGLVYQKITSSGDLFIQDNSGLLREENNIVYLIPKDSLNEVILYNFNLEQGDTFYIDLYFDFGSTTPYVTVQYVDSIMTNDGIYRNYFQLSEGTSWIEGIGADYGTITYPWYQFSVSGDCQLQCFSKDSIHVLEEIVTINTGYETYSYDCDGIITNIEEINQEQNFTISPNPFSSQIALEAKNINLLKSRETKIKIHDLNGKELYSAFQRIEDITLIDLHFLNSGIYFVSLENSLGQIYFEKLVKM